MHWLCRPDVSTSFYIKTIFDSCLKYLIENLDLGASLATWQSCYIKHIVANLGSSKYYLNSLFLILVLLKVKLIQFYLQKPIFNIIFHVYSTLCKASILNGVILYFIIALLLVGNRLRFYPKKKYIYHKHLFLLQSLWLSSAWMAFKIIASCKITRKLNQSNWTFNTIMVHCSKLKKGRKK